MKNMRRYIILLLLNLMVLSGALFYFFKIHNRDVQSEIKEYLSDVYKIEKAIIRNFPIYSDYKTAEIEKELRTHLFKDHIKVAKEIGVGPLKDKQMIEKYVKEKKLINIDAKEKDYYFYGVKKEYRYLTPKTYEGLKLIGDRFQKKLKKAELTFKVKLAVSSAMRPEAYQTNLRKRNLNAVIKSTHSYGVSFDIFWDDYYLVLPEGGERALSKEIIEPIRRKMGFVLGDSLRRQLRALLTATLLDLQREGYIYAIMERRQHCYHVTVLDKVEIPSD